MTLARPLVSVIVPHFNDLAGLKICLQRLRAQTYPADRMEIIIADNASPCGIAAVEAVVAGRAKVVLIMERGAGPARNGAVALATGEILAFIDSDCQAEEAWIEEGVKALAGADLIGGRVRVLVDDEADMTPVEAFERVFAFDFKTYIERKGFSGAGNLFCSRALFAAVGGFGTGLSEDVDWSRRAVAAGNRLAYAPLAVVGHPARRTWDELVRKWRRVNLETLGLLKKSGGGRTKWVLRSLALPLSAVAHTPKVLTSHELHNARQRLAALGVLYRLRFWRAFDAARLLVEDMRASVG